MSADKNSGHTNPDAITGAPASHPGATGIGAASGAATGAAVGMIGGPIGIAIGAIAGGIVGGLTGHEIGEWNDPSDQAYWKDEYKKRDYYDKSADYDNDVAPALNYGGTLATTTASDSAPSGAVASAFSAVEDKAKQGWQAVRGNSKLSYDQARSAISDAYGRKIQLHEQKLRAEKDRVQTGEARIQKQVIVENKTIQVPVEREELVIERHAVSGGSATGQDIGAEEIRIPLSEERVRIEKDTFVTEEVSIGKKVRTETQEVGGEVKKEKLVIDDGKTTGSGKLKLTHTINMNQALPSKKAEPFFCSLHLPARVKYAYRKVPGCGNTAV